jgi:hypothetical protein
MQQNDEQSSQHRDSKRCLEHEECNRRSEHPQHERAYNG